MVAVKRRKKVTVRAIAFALTIIMLAGILPGNIMGDLTASAAGDTGWTASPGEILVTTQAELSSALTGTAYHTIYLGADITNTNLIMLGGGSVRNRVVIDGINPRTGAMHTLTTSTAFRLGTSSNRVTDITFQNIHLRQNSGSAGFVSVASTASGAGTSITFDNADIVVYRTVLYPGSGNGTSTCDVKIKDSYLSTTNIGASATRMIGARYVELSGDVTINSNSGTALAMFAFGNTFSNSANSAFTVRKNAVVNISIASGAQAGFCSSLRNLDMVIEEGAYFSFTGGNLCYETGSNDTAREFTVEKNATCRLNFRGNRTRLSANVLNVNESASLYVWAGAYSASNYRRATHTPRINLNSPFRVVFATSGSVNDSLFFPNTVLDASKIKSIRYFTTGGGSFDSQMNYTGDYRSDYRNWWFQEKGLFDVFASNLGTTGLSINSSYNIADNSVRGAEAAMNSTNFRATAIRAIQIDGGSRAPAIDPVYAGSKTVSGTGQPGSEITVTWPTLGAGGASRTPTSVVEVDSGGIWSATVPDDLLLEISDERPGTQVKATQRETVYNLDRGDSYPVYEPVKGSAMKLIGFNTRNVYYNDGEIPDRAEILFFGAGLSVNLPVGGGRYIITNADIKDPGNSLAFETLWNSTGDEYKGYMAANSNTYWRAELCDIPANCTVWAMATVTMGGNETTLFDTLRYANLFKRKAISLRLVEGNPADPPGALNVISPYALIGGNDGIPYTLDGTILTGANVKYNRVSLSLNNYMSDYWTAKMKTGDDAPVTIVLGTGFPSDYLAMSDDAEGLKYTLYMTRVPELWKRVYLEFADKDGTPIPDTLGEADFIWIPMDIREDDREYGEDEEAAPPEADITSSDFLLRGGRYNPQKHYPYSPIGYYVSADAINVTETTGNPSKLNRCADFTVDFNPEITDITAVPKEKIYIVFDVGITDILETHTDTATGAPIYPDKISSAKIEVGNAGLRYTAPRISGYAPVGYELHNLPRPYSGAFSFDPSLGHSAAMDQNGSVYVDLAFEMIEDGFSPGAPEFIKIVWKYARDINNNGIPDDEEVRIDVFWYGYYPGISAPAALDSLRIFGRTGQELVITNDGSDSGDIGHVIRMDTGAFKGSWIFDAQTAGNDKLARVTPVETSPQNVIFYYAYSSDGIMPDNEQYIDISFSLWDDGDGNGASNPEPPDRKYALRGSDFAYTPDSLAGYVYYGFQLDGGALTATYANGAPNAEISFTTTEYTHKLNLVYIKAGEPVNVYWLGYTLSGHGVLIGSKPLAGFVGEEVSVARDDVATENFWIPAQGESGRETFTLNTTPGRAHTFNFVEKKISVEITTSGVSDDGLLDFKTRQTAAYPGTPFTVRAIEGFYGYRVVGYSVYDRFGFEITPFTRGSSVAVDPAMGDQSVVFKYESTITNLRIRAVEEGAADNILFEKVITDLSVGQKYAALAPFISDAWALKGNTLREMTITDGFNEAVFEYSPLLGDVTVILREADSNGTPVDPGRYMKAFGANVGDIIEPAAYLAEDYYTPCDAAPVRIGGSGTSPVYIDYTKDMTDVTIVPVNAATGFPIAGAGRAARQARRGEMFTATACAVPGYTLMEAASKEVYADPGTNPAEVRFDYKKDATGRVVIRHYYMEGGEKAILSDSVIELAADSKLTVAAADYSGSGFVFADVIYVGAPAVAVYGSEAEITVSADEKDNVIELLYTDARKTVTVRMKKDAAGAAPVETHRFVPRDDAKVYPPYVEGYALTGYIADGAETDTPTAVDSTFTGVAFDGIDADHDVIFVYGQTETVVNGKYADITVRGTAGGMELYSYVKRIAKTELPYTLLDGLDVFTVPGYTLDAAQNHLVTPGTNVYTFNYTGVEGTVKITLREQNSGSLLGAGSFNAAATVARPFSFLAPAVDGYRLITASNIGFVASVAADGSSEIVFEYVKILGKVTLVYKEDDASGAIIRVDEIASPVSGGGALAPPATLPGYYTLKAGCETVPYNWNAADALQLEAYYVKDTIDIEVLTISAADGVTDLGGSFTLQGLRKGEVVAVTAPAVSGHVTVGADTRLVYADGSPVTFLYHNLAASGVTVNVFAGSAAGEILYTYVIPAVSGSSVTVDPATVSIAGFSHNAAHADNRLTVQSGSGEDIRVIMTDNRRTLTVKTSVGGAESTAYTERVINGASVTLAPPHKQGYIPVAYSINGGVKTALGSGFTGYTAPVTSDIEITYYYNSIADIIPDYMVTLTVSGSDGVNTLYSYAMQIPAGVTASVTYVSVAGYSLDPDAGGNYENGAGAGSFGTLPVSLAANGSVTFRYVKNTRDVYVDAQCNGASLTGYPQKLGTLAVGDTLVGFAPVIPGYQPAASEPVSKSHTVSASTAPYGNAITFTYVKSAGNVLFQYADEDTGAVLYQVRESFNTGVGTAGLTPSQSPPIPLGWELKNGDGEPSASEAAVGVNTVISFTLRKVMKTVTVRYHKTGATDEAATATTLRAQLGAAIDVLAAPADLIPGWSLTGSAYLRHTVSANDADNEVIFFYSDNSAAPVGTLTIIGCHDGKLLYSNTSALTVGSAYSITPLSISGYTNAVWRGASGAQSGIMTASGVTVIYDFDMDKAEIKIYVKDTRGNPLPAVSYESAAACLYMTKAVQKGGDADIYAPSFDGWVIAGASVYQYSGAAGGEEAVFVYKSVQDYIDESFIEVTARGVVQTTGAELYSYVSLLRRDSGVYTVNARTVPGYAVAGFGAKSVIVESANITVTFEYVSRLSARPSVNPVAAGDGVITGTGVPGAEITVTLPGGADVSAAVGSGGVWSADIPAGREPSAGERITVVQTEPGKDPGGEVIVITGPGSGGGVIPTLKPEPTPEPGPVYKPSVSEKIRDTFEVDEHIKYITGYPDKSVRPDDNITRAEVAALFWKLLKAPEKNDAVSGGFTDVKDGAWFAQAVKGLADMGVINGYDDGAFRPSQNITRAEFAAIVSRFDDLATGISSPFTDVTEEHWAYAYIVSAYAKGWVSGYPGGEFKPKNSITRAEVVKIVNHMLGRGIKREDIPKEVYTLYPDLPATHWAFAEVIEASVSHKYEWKDDGYEIWTEHETQAYAAPPTFCAGGYPTMS